VAAKNEISTGYVPRPFQSNLHKKLKRFNVLVCHRRFGKTVFAVNHTIDRALRNPLKNPQYAYIAPTYGQAKRIVWDMVKEYTQNLPGVTTHEQDLRLEIQRPDRGDKVRIMLLGAENPGSIKGIYLDGVILDEFAECVPSIWGEAVRPTLSDRDGWAIFIGTPKGQNHFWDVHQKALKLGPENDWFTQIYRASETGVIRKSELEAAAMEMEPEEYEQEYECSFSAALVGSYYGKILEELEEKDRITDVPYDAALPVNTYWDLGIGDTTAIWFGQRLRDEYRWIDYVEQSGEGLEFYVKELQKRGYVWGEHIFPHDAAARELGSGKSRIEMLRSLGVQGRVLEKHKLDDGIHAARQLLRKSWFDRIKCERGLAALRNYTRKFDSKNKLWSTKPLHNWASNGADSFRYAAMGSSNDGLSGRRDRSRQNQVDDLDYNIFGG
jgi:hypothetical protein